MEFIEGKSITEYVSARQLLPAGILKLFLQLCGAVQHCHQRMLVHRDIKPANVLVDGSDRIKLLDFGIAKLTGTQAMSGLTQAGLAPMTYPYAAPEQWTGEPATTATDIHGLGVLLFELLTGSLPWRRDGDDLEDWRVAICERNPLKLRGATPNTPGLLGADLEAILERALAKKPEDRFRSVVELIQEVERVLAGRPSLSRRTRGVRDALRLAMRHKVSIAALVCTFGGLSFGLIRARQAEARAVEALARGRQLLTGVLRDSTRWGTIGTPEALAASRDITQRGEAFLNELENLAENDAAFAAEVLELQARAAGIHGEHFAAHTGERELAEARCRKALQLAARYRARFPDDYGIAKQELSLEMLMGNILVGLEKRQEALAQFQKAQLRAESLIQRYPGSEDGLGASTVARSMQGDLLLEQGRVDEAESIQRQVLAERERLYGRALDWRQRQMLAGSHVSLGGVHVFRGQWDKASAEYGAAERILTAYLAAEPANQEAARANGGAPDEAGRASEGDGKREGGDTATPGGRGDSRSSDGARLGVCAGPPTAGERPCAAPSAVPTGRRSCARQEPIGRPRPTRKWWARGHPWDRHRCKSRPVGTETRLPE